MKLFELRGTLLITERKVNNLKAIESRIESQLTDLNARITKVDNEITFSRTKLYASLGTLIPRYESLGFMREGRIEMSKESHSVKISWTVKLDSVYFFALCCSILAGIIASINTELAISVGIGVMIFLMFVFIGIVLITSQMNNLINSTVDQDYY